MFHRYQNHRLSALEVWHGLCFGQTLFELKNSEHFHHALLHFLEMIQGGQALTSDSIDTENLLKAKDFEQVIFTGGGTLSENFKSYVRIHECKFPFEVLVDSQGQFGQSVGAKRIASEMRWQNGFTFDLGQTQLKLLAASSEFTLERDLNLLPIGRDALDFELGQKRVLEFLKRGYDQLCDKTNSTPDGLLFALPLKIDEYGYGDTCSYPGLSGDLRKLLATSFQEPIVLINDAELASVSFLSEMKSKTMIITLGFGVGGAVCVP